MRYHGADMKKEGKSLFSFGEVTIIALVTLIGYLMAYVYEWSALNYFGIAQFANVTLSRTLVCIIGAIVGILIFATLFSFFTWINSKTCKKIKKSVFFVGWMVFLLIMSVLGGIMAMHAVPWIGPVPSFLFSFGIILFMILLLLEIFSATLKERDPKLNSIERLFKYEEEKMDKGSDGGDFGYFLKATNSHVPFIISLLGTIFFIFAIYCGPAFASAQYRFGTIMLNGQMLVLIRSYDDRYLFVPYEILKDPTADREVIVLTSDVLAQKGVSISFKEIGPFNGYSNAMFKIWAKN